MYRLKAKNDFVFQRIFGRQENKEILISFLNAVLMLENDSMLTDIEIIDNTRLEKDKRTLFYWSKLFTEQLSEGQAFNDLKKTITINS